MTGDDGAGRAASTKISAGISTGGAPTRKLAARWDAAPDGLSYRFELRPDVRWHDGKPLTSDDLAYSVLEVWKKYHARGRTTFANTRLCEILGAARTELIGRPLKEFLPGEGTPQSWSGVTHAGPSAQEVRLLGRDGKVRHAIVTVRAIGPTWSRLLANGLIPLSMTKCELIQYGFIPTIPQNDAGRVIEPPVCVPSAPQHMPQATAAADPLDDPLGVRSRFHGLRVAPQASGCVVGRLPISGLFVRPAMTSPAALNRATSVVSVVSILAAFLSATLPFDRV